MNLKETVLTSDGFRLLDTTTESGSLDDLTILCSGSGTGIGLTLLDITHRDSILMSLAVPSLG